MIDDHDAARDLSAARTAGRWRRACRAAARYHAVAGFHGRRRDGRAWCRGRTRPGSAARVARPRGSRVAALRGARGRPGESALPEIQFVRVDAQVAPLSRADRSGALAGRRRDAGSRGDGAAAIKAVRRRQFRVAGLQGSARRTTHRASRCLRGARAGARTTSDSVSSCRTTSRAPTASMPESGRRSPRRTSMAPSGRPTCAIGANPRFSTEFYQPIGYASELVRRTKAAGRASQLRLHSTDDRLATYRVRNQEAGLDVGREFGSWGELRAGLIRGEGDARSAGRRFRGSGLPPRSRLRPRRIGCALQRWTGWTTSSFRAMASRSPCSGTARARDWAPTSSADRDFL